MWRAFQDCQKIQRLNKIFLRRTNGPDPITLTGKAVKKGLRVMFISDKKTFGDGAQFTAECLEGAATTEAPTTTLG